MNVALEYRSQLRIWGVPFVHVAWGLDPFTGGPRVARGIIAVGPVALGVVAVGPVAVGLVAVGQLAAALVLAAGQVAAAIGAVGQLALGAPLAVGQIAMARAAHGQLTVEGPLAQAGLAVAWLLMSMALLWAWRRSRGNLARPLGRRQIISAAAPGVRLLRGRIVPLRTV